MLNLAVNMALLTLWVLLLYLSSKNLKAILIGVAVGMLPVALLSVFMELFLLETVGITTTMMQVSATIVAPIVEEPLKFLFIFLPVWRSRITSSEVRIFGAATGLGFAYFENLGVITDTLAIVLRSFTSWPMHIITALLLSYSVENIFTEERNLTRTATYFLIAITIHASFNYILLFWIR